MRHQPEGFDSILRWPGGGRRVLTLLKGYAFTRSSLGS
jgi:hypothetical protein